MIENPELELETDEHGRVGYGKLARYSPLILAAIMVVAVIVIALNQRDRDANIRDIVGEPAPDLTFLAFDGSGESTLESLEGNVVVLNFWASWCDPCLEEMPAFDAVHRANPGDVRIIGVNIKNDRVENANQFLLETGVTYQIARDGGGDHQLYGPIEQALGIGGSYPVTVFIRPDGVIESITVGPMLEPEILDAIENARS